MTDVIRFAREVAEGTLSPRAAMLLADKYPGALKALAALPHGWQDRLAEGEVVQVAVWEEGRITRTETRVDKLTTAEMAFPPSGDYQEGIEGGWKAGAVQERRIWRMAIERYFDGTAVEDVERYVEEIRKGVEGEE